MRARISQKGGGKSQFEIDLNSIDEKLVSSRQLIAGLVNGLKRYKLKDPVAAYTMVHNVIEAIGAMPAHSGYGSWTKQNDFKPKGWKWVCDNCFKIAYALPSKDGYCDYEYCPHCGVRMVKEVPACFKKGEAQE